MLLAWPPRRSGPIKPIIKPKLEPAAPCVTERRKQRFSAMLIDVELETGTVITSRASHLFYHYLGNICLEGTSGCKGGADLMRMEA